MLEIISEEIWRERYIDCFRELCAFLNEHDIEYSLAFGSMLGCVREEQMIRWDYDIDFFIDAKNIDKILSIKHLLPNKFEFIKEVSNGVGLHRIIISDLYEIYNDTLFKCFFDFFEFIEIEKKDLSVVTGFANEYEEIIRKLKNVSSGFKAFNFVKKIYYKLKFGSDIKSFLRKKIYKYKKEYGDSIFILYKVLSFDKPKKIIMKAFEKVQIGIFDNYDDILTEYFGNDYMKPKQLDIYDRKNFFFFQKI